MTDPIKLSGFDFQFTMSEEQARNVHKVVDSHSQALKNWIASAVESEDYERAHRMVDELRQYQALYAAFNLTARFEIAEATGKPVERIRHVEDRGR